MGDLRDDGRCTGFGAALAGLLLAGFRADALRATGFLAGFVFRAFRVFFVRLAMSSRSLVEKT